MAVTKQWSNQDRHIFILHGQAEGVNLSQEHREENIELVTPKTRRQNRAHIDCRKQEEQTSNADPRAPKVSRINILFKETISPKTLEAFFDLVISDYPPAILQDSSTPDKRQSSHIFPFVTWHHADLLNDWLGRHSLIALEVYSFLPYICVSISYVRSSPIVLPSWEDVYPPYPVNL